jgi:hypothetical protein
MNENFLLQTKKQEAMHALGIRKLNLGPILIYYCSNSIAIATLHFREASPRAR